ASALADALLSGSNPVRLSVKIEFAAYLYDCLHDAEASRRLASQAIKDVYNDSEGMTEDMFEDATEQYPQAGRRWWRGKYTESREFNEYTTRDKARESRYTTSSTTGDEWLQGGWQDKANVAAAFEIKSLEGTFGAAVVELAIAGVT
ncbi:MAG: hypothetical protein Q9224_007487, partial [Gallowayella concinna]